MSLRGNVLISGGTSGIGLELARIFLRQGHKVAVVGLQPNHSQQAAEQLYKYQDSVKVYTVDLAQNAGITSLVADFHRDFGSIDILVNNAGYATYETFVDSSPEQIHRLAMVNLVAHLDLTRALLPTLLKSSKAKILNVSSVAGDLFITPNAVYMACKQAMNAWTYALHYELAAQGVQVKLFCPSRVDTAFFHHPTFQNRILRSEMKKFMTAKEVAEWIYEKHDSKGLAFYKPQRFLVIRWLFHAIPYFKTTLFASLMFRRIADYQKKGNA